MAKNGKVNKLLRYRFLILVLLLSCFLTACNEKSLDDAGYTITTSYDDSIKAIVITATPKPQQEGEEKSTPSSIDTIHLDFVATIYDKDNEILYQQEYTNFTISGTTGNFYLGEFKPTYIKGEKIDKFEIVISRSYIIV